MKRATRPYLVKGALACGVLYYVLELSRGDRGPVDWTVIGLVLAAILWNVVQAVRGLLMRKGTTGG